MSLAQAAFFVRKVRGNIGPGKGKAVVIICFYVYNLRSGLPYHLCLPVENDPAFSRTVVVLSLFILQGVTRAAVVYICYSVILFDIWVGNCYLDHFGKNPFGIITCCFKPFHTVNRKILPGPSGFST